MTVRPPRLGLRDALLLDLDGTLLDIAPTPDAVVVPAGLVESLRAILASLGNALAVLTGRPVETVSALLDHVPHAIAGEHGAAIRHAPGAAVERPVLPVPRTDWLAQAQEFAAALPGVLLERKSHGFVLHYRLAPETGEDARDLLAGLHPATEGSALLAAHMAWEIRPAGIDKGRALEQVMARPPFLGRVPFFIGDDVTDEDAIRAATAAGGTGLRVADAFGDPSGVRAWLAEAAASMTSRSAARLRPAPQQ